MLNFTLRLHQPLLSIDMVRNKKKKEKDEQSLL